MSSDREERLAQQRMSQIDYSVDLQRIIEDLCNNRDIQFPKTGARHHYDMAIAYRAAIAALPAPAEEEITLAQFLLLNFTILAKPAQEGQGS